MEPYGKKMQLLAAHIFPFYQAICTCAIGKGEFVRKKKKKKKMRKWELDLINFFFIISVCFDEFNLVFSLD